MTSHDLPAGTPAIVSSCILIVLWAVRQAEVVPARYLPLIACSVGVAFVTLIEGLTVEALSLGLVCGAGATGFHQAGKQIRNQ